MTGLGLNRTAYWRFLRRTYGMGALEAWTYIKRVGLPPSIASVRRALRGDP
jgi:hypothetical protein